MSDECAESTAAAVTEAPDLDLTTGAVPLPARFTARIAAGRGGPEAYCRRMNMAGVRVHHDAVILVDGDGVVFCVLDSGCAHEAYLSAVGGGLFVALAEAQGDPDATAH